MNITITGPRSVGKTSISKILAEKMNLKYFSSDEMGDKYLKKEDGLDKAIKSGKIKKFIKKEGYSLIENVYKKEKNFVFDLSGGAFTSKKFKEVSKKVREIAKKKSIVIGFLPSKNIFSSIWVLFNREIKRKHFENYNKFFLFYKTLKHYSRFPKILRENSDFIIYTKNKKPENIVKEIIEKIKTYEN